MVTGSAVATAPATRASAHALEYSLVIVIDCAMRSARSGSVAANENQMIHPGKPGMTTTRHWTPRSPRLTKTCFLPSATVLTLT